MATGRLWPVMLVGGLLLVQGAGRAAGGQTASPTTSETAALAADRSWLQLIDGGKYGDGWAAAAALLRAAVPAEAFAKGVASARDPLGAVEMRKVQSSTYATSLPGAPDGSYVVTVFATQFAHKAAARETVTAMQEKDGSWRVSGYYIK